MLLLNHNFRRWHNVRFPDPLLVSESVLVESWEDGVIISDFIARYSKWREGPNAGSGGKEGGSGRGNGMCGAVFGAYTHLQHYVQDAVMAKLRPVLQVLLPAGGAPVGAEQGKERRPSLSVELAHFIVSVGEDLYLKMLLVDNLMHGAWCVWDMWRDACVWCAGCTPTRTKIILAHFGLSLPTDTSTRTRNQTLCLSLLTDLPPTQTHTRKQRTCTPATSSSM